MYGSWLPRWSLFVLALAIVCIVPGLRAEAGTTGALTGVVARSNGTPIAGARVVATSPSQTATVTTDASGRFSMLSLAPDTYTLTVSKDGFDTSTITGLSVFADQVQTIHVALAPSLRTIAHVTARSAMDVVKPGTTSDIYSVNSTVTQAAAGLGGGGNLNNAYSAIAAVPGVSSRPTNRAGIKQCTFAAATTIRSATSTTACRSTVRSTTIRGARRGRSASKNCRSMPAAALRARVRRA